MLIATFRIGPLRRLFALAIAVLALLVFTLFTPSSDGAPALSPAAAQGTPLPVIMYHGLLRDPAMAGPYVLSPDDFEADILYLQQHGYETVSMQQVIDYVLHDGPLPEKPVLLTLDDGCLNNLTYLPDILERTDTCALVSVVGQYVSLFTERPDPNPSYAYMTWSEIAELAATGRVEIGNHSWGFHAQSPRRGSTRLQGESDTQYRDILTSDAQRLQDALTENCDLTPQVYTYPYGQISAGADEILCDMGFTATLSCYELVTTLIPGQPDCLYSIGRYNRPSGIASADFFAGIGLN